MRLTWPQIGVGALAAFYCSLMEQQSFAGRLFLTERFVCFSSSAHDVKFSVQLILLARIQKSTGLFFPSITLFVANSDKKYILSSFFNFHECWILLSRLHQMSMENSYVTVENFIKTAEKSASVRRMGSSAAALFADITGGSVTAEDTAVSDAASPTPSATTTQATAAVTQQSMLNSHAQQEHLKSLGLPLNEAFLSSSPFACKLWRCEQYCEVRAYAPGTMERLTLMCSALLQGLLYLSHNFICFHSVPPNFYFSFVRTDRESAATCDSMRCLWHHVHGRTGDSVVCCGRYSEGKYSIGHGSQCNCNSLV